MNSRKPTLTRPITPSTRATISSGRWRLDERDGDASSRRASAPTAASSLRASPRSRRTGSAAAAASSSWSRRSAPRSRWSTNEYARQPNASATNRNCPARDRPRERHPARRSPRAAPTSGSVPSTSASSSARISAKWPSSGIMACLASLLQRRAAFSAAASLCACSTACGGLGRHVVLVVLRQHLGRAEHAVGAELALRDDALALLEEVGKDAV